MATAIHGSAMFKTKNKEQALALMLLCQAENIHPVLALRRYHITPQGPSMRADAMQGEFEARGGKVVFHIREDDIVAATFYAPGVKIDEESIKRGQLRYEAKTNKDRKLLATLSQPGEDTVIRTMEEAERTGIATCKTDNGDIVLKDNWRRTPRAMLTARCVTEGIRAIYPGLVSGIYTPEELEDISPDTTEADQDQARQQAKDARQEQAASNVAAAVNNRDQDAGEVTQVNSETWGDVECHIGTPTGPFLGRKLIELFGPNAKRKHSIKLMEWLETEYLPEQEKLRAALGKKHNPQNSRLMDAIKEARKALDARLAAEDAEATTSKPEATPAAEAQTPEVMQPSEPLPETKPAEPVKLRDWRDTIIPFKCKLHGEKLGKLPAIGDFHPVAVLTAIQNQVIDSETVFKSVEPKAAKAFAADYALATAELGINPELNKEGLLKVLRSRVNDLVISEDTFCEKMEEYGVFPRSKPKGKRHAANYTEDDLRLALLKWPEVETSICHEFNLPTVAERKKGVK